MTTKLAAALASLALSTIPVLAQTPRPTARPAQPTKAAPAMPAPSEATMQERAEQLTASMTQGLGLTPAQAEKVRAINLNAVRNAEAARQRYGQHPTKVKAAIDDIGLARLEQLKEVLSTVQFMRYQQKREQKMGIPSMSSNQGNLPPGLNTGAPGGE